MSEFTDSLGIKSGDSVVILDDGNELFRRLSLEAPEDVALQKRVLGDKVEMIIVRLGEDVDPTQLFSRIKRGLKPDGAFWAVTQANNPEFHSEMLKGANEADLVEAGTVSFSEEEVGTRFIVRKEDSR